MIESDFRATSYKPPNDDLGAINGIKNTKYYGACKRRRAGMPDLIQSVLLSYVYYWSG